MSDHNKDSQDERLEGQIEGIGRWAKMKWRSEGQMEGTGRQKQPEQVNFGGDVTRMRRLKHRLKKVIGTYQAQWH